MKNRLWLTWMLVGMLVLSACAPQTPAPPAAPPNGEMLAPVESIEVLLLESTPAQVNVIVEGMMPDACTKAGPITQRREGEVFFVEIAMTRSDDEVCAQVLTPYEEAVSLDVEELPVGTYTVDVNGTREVFTLTTDDLPPIEE